MFKVFSFCSLFLLSSLVYGQSDDFPTNDVTDEFELTEPAFEVNSSKENIGTEAPSTEPDIVEEMSRPEQPPKPTRAQNIQEPDAAEKKAEATQENDFVLVREKQTTEQNNSNNEITSVEVRSKRDIFLPYKQRQDKWGWTVSLGAEFMTFPEFVSLYDTNTFQDLFGADPAPMHSIEFGTKYNASYGSFGLSFGFGSLSVESARIGALAEMSLTKYSATATYYFDTIWPEPYFVPYFGAGVWQAEFTEKSEAKPGENKHYTTDPGYHWRAGALIGLDWLEPNTALRSRRFIGLQGTFINIYATSSYMSESNPDPNLENEMDFGASLLLEF